MGIRHLLNAEIMSQKGHASDGLDARAVLIDQPRGSGVLVAIFQEPLCLGGVLTVGGVIVA